MTFLPSPPLNCNLFNNNPAMLITISHWHLNNDTLNGSLSLSSTEVVLPWAQKKKKAVSLPKVLIKARGFFSVFSFLSYFFQAEICAMNELCCLISFCSQAYSLPSHAWPLKQGSNYLLQHAASCTAVWQPFKAIENAQLLLCTEGSFPCSLPRPLI